jgi:hypothetical protein
VYQFDKEKKKKVESNYGNVFFQLCASNTFSVKIHFKLAKSFGKQFIAKIHTYFELLFRGVIAFAGKPRERKTYYRV